MLAQQFSSLYLELTLIQLGFLNLKANYSFKALVNLSQACTQIIS